MRRWSLVGAWISALFVAAAITVAFPRLPLFVDAMLASAVCLTPGVIAIAGRRDASSVASLVAGAIAAPIVIATSWFFAHPVLHVDDATDRPMQIWLDDAPLVIVSPTPDRGEPPHVRVAWGKHRLGWSEIGARAPADAIDVHVDFTGTYLYAPSAAGCYWIEARSYGDASLHDVPHGPQRVQELLRFDHVDVWFDDNPTSLHRTLFHLGGISIAVQRYGQCMDLARAGCGVDARRDFVECLTTLHGAAPNADCLQKALDACSDGDGAHEKK